MEEPIPTQTSTQPVTRLGSYRLVEPLGSGGMSSVFRAVHDSSGYEVALKVLPRYLAKNPTLLQRFLREAQSAEALEHPNIVSIYDRGAENGRHYLVLEFVDGSDLHDLVRQHGPMSVVDALRIVREAAQGLLYAASKGVIHRDIKPANILMSREGAVKLIDLGLALQSESEDERVTRHGTTVGTVDYMSPEQARDSRAANEQSDIYSLGCTLYYLLTGFPPFAGGHIADKLRRHATQPPPDVRQLRPDVPRSVAKFIQRLMAKRPVDRYKTYEELIADLDFLDLNDADSGSGSFEFALIADDDDSADFDLGEGVEAIEAPSTRDFSPVSEPTSRAKPAPQPGAAGPPGGEPELKLDELAALLKDDDDDESTPRRAPAPSAPPGEPLPRGRSAHRERPAPPAEPFDPFGDLGEEDDLIAPMPLRGRRSYGQDASVKAWAIGGALVGLVIALLGFAIISLIRMDWSRGPTSPSQPAESRAAPGDVGVRSIAPNSFEITPGDGSRPDRLPSS
ncbi:protein kinase [Tautonia sp. JC769]|uniref:serine/threonine-protein kinase n=1 Tax=Tautonia sp. JC769 TaxID=3232135 RepID=UPI003459C188